MAKSLRDVARIVWDNDVNMRFIPRATNPGESLSWRVFDQVEGRFLSDREVKKIDPKEQMLPN